MARILYGVMGDSRGHLSRSLAVAGELSRHEIVFAGGGLVGTVGEQGYRSIPLPMLGTVLRNGAVDTMGTLVNTARELLRRGQTLTRLRREMEALKPDLVITDYEYYTPLAARQLGLPCLSIDHQHVVTQTRYQTPPGQGWNRLCTSLPIRHLFSNAQRFLVSSFFAPPVADPARVELFGPVLRPQPLKYTASAGDHVLVYLRGASLKAVVNLLDGRARRYVIYGFGEGTGTANCVFKKPSVEGFLEDLASAAAVLSNGGHSLLSESFHFGKPVCCVPTGMFYEQYLNAWFVEQLGYGRLMPDIAHGEILDDFESRIPTFAAALAGKSFHGNAALAARVESLL